MGRPLHHAEAAKRFSERRLTWKSIKEVIHPDAYSNPAWKGILYFVRDTFIAAAVFAALVLVEDWYLVLPLWILAGLSISGLFVIGHDAAHGALFQNKRLSWWLGQIAMLPSLHAFHQWAYGHNRVHHGHTIKLEADFVWHPVSPQEYASFFWIKRALHRLYWSPVGAGPYYLIEIWLKGMALYTAPQPGARRDKWIVGLFAIAASALLIYFGGNTNAGFDYAAAIWTWTRVFLVPFIIWNYIMGFTVYVHHINDRIPWKARADWSPAYGQLFGTVNYHLPGPINFFLHNIYIHMPHHVQVRIPFYNLPLALESIKDVYGEHVIERTTPLRDYLRATKLCKLFDAESGRWLTYKEAQAIS